MKNKISLIAMVLILLLPSILSQTEDFGMGDSVAITIYRNTTMNNTQINSPTHFFISFKEKISLIQRIDKKSNHLKSEISFNQTKVTISNNLEEECPINNSNLTYEIKNNEDKASKILLYLPLIVMGLIYLLLIYFGMYTLVKKSKENNKMFINNQSWIAIDDKTKDKLKIIKKNDISWAEFINNLKLEGKKDGKTK